MSPDSRSCWRNSSTPEPRAAPFCKATIESNCKKHHKLAIQKHLSWRSGGEGGLYPSGSNSAPSAFRYVSSACFPKHTKVTLSIEAFLERKLLASESAIRAARSRGKR